MLCRHCGYDLSAVDLDRSEYRCPECGIVNIPNDIAASPIVARARLNPAIAVLGFIWPGGAFAGSMVVMNKSVVLFPLCVFLAPIFLCGMFVWPWIWSHLLMMGRIPRQQRTRNVALFCVVAIPGNIAVAAGLLKAAVWAGLVL